jgi:hypothetical protein
VRNGLAASMSSGDRTPFADVSRAACLLVPADGSKYLAGTGLCAGHSRERQCYRCRLGCFIRRCLETSRMDVRPLGLACCRRKRLCACGRSQRGPDG